MGKSYVDQTSKQDLGTYKKTVYDGNGVAYTLNYKVNSDGSSVIVSIAREGAEGPVNFGVTITPEALVTAKPLSAEQEKFFDNMGKLDVTANSILGITSEGVKITFDQISKSKYWTQATKSSTLTLSKNLKFLGYVGMAGGTLVSGYELYSRGGQASDWVRFGTGLAITGIAFIPVVGLPASIILGAIEASGGFDEYYSSFDKPTVTNGYTPASMFDTKYRINDR